MLRERCVCVWPEQNQIPSAPSQSYSCMCQCSMYPAPAQCFFIPKSWFTHMSNWGIARTSSLLTHMIRTLSRHKPSTVEAEFINEPIVCQSYGIYKPECLPLICQQRDASSQALVAVPEEWWEWSNQFFKFLHSNKCSKQIIFCLQVLLNATPKNLRKNCYCLCNLPLAKAQIQQPLHRWFQVLLNAITKNSWRTCHCLCNLPLAKAQFQQPLHRWFQFLLNAIPKNLWKTCHCLCSLPLAKAQFQQPLHRWFQVLLNAITKNSWKTCHCLCNLPLAKAQF